MAKVVFIEYTVFFDPNTTFKHYDDFAKSLTDFFNAQNMDAEVLDNLPDHPQRHMIYIRAKKPAAVPPEVQQTPQIGPQQALKKIVEKVRLDNLPKKKSA